MQALTLDAPNKTARLSDAPSPSLSHSDDILIRVHAIALNPVDALYVANPLGQSGRVVGSDFAGVVVDPATLPSTPSPYTDNSIANESTGALSIGTRVAGFLQGACSVNDRPGAFAEYLVCPHDLVWYFSGDTSIAGAATVSLCALTAAQALFYRLELPSPFDWDERYEHGRRGEHVGRHDDEGKVLTVFIYGASTSVGMYAAQLVNHIPLTPHYPSIRLIGAASHKHHAYLRAAPCTYIHLVSYTSPTWPGEVLALTQGKGVDIIYDCISEGDTVAQCASILRPRGKMAIVRSKEGGAFTPLSAELDGKVQPVYGAVCEGLGEEVQYQGMTVPKDERARVFAVAFYEWLSGGDGGRLVPNPVRIMPGGLERIVEDGFVLLGAGGMSDREAAKKRTEEWMRPVSGEKLVYLVGEQ